MTITELKIITSLVKKINSNNSTLTLKGVKARCKFTPNQEKLLNHYCRFVDSCSGLKETY